MVKRCSYGLCNSDNRYPERLENGVQFVPFPKPKTNYEKCLRWIKLCGRPHNQLNTERINSNRYICTKHFVNQSWPTREHPDPLPADLSTQESTASPKRRRLHLRKNPKEATQNCTPEVKQELPIPSDHATCPYTDREKENPSESLHISSQTACTWVNPLDLMSLSVENRQLKQDLTNVTLELTETKRKLTEALTKQQEKNVHVNKSSFSYDKIQGNGELISYYTGFSKETFLAVFNFLVPNEEECHIECNMKESHTSDQVRGLCLRDQLLLTLCKLRLNQDFIDLGFRFGITKQMAKTTFEYWINKMFIRFKEIPVWPHRDTLSMNMPESYKKVFPNTFAILECIVIKTESPFSTEAQTEVSSDHNSDSMKGILAVDPRGSVMFASTLVPASTSDKDLFQKTGFQDHLLKLVEIGFLNQGDGVMSDADFEDAVKEVGLCLNIPPLATSSAQIPGGEDEGKIERQRVHVGHTIKNIKTFQIISQRLPATLISDIDKIWFVCTFLTNFMPFGPELLD